MCRTVHVLAILYLIISLFDGQNANTFTNTTCEGVSLTIRCPTTTPASVITIQDALYGRMTTAICNDTRIRSTNCSSPNATSVVKNSCNNRSNCTIVPSNTLFGDPCPNTYKYLNVTYECGPVCTPPCATCPSGVCTSCLAGYYLDSNNNCTKCSTCGPFEYETGGCNGLINRECPACVSPCETCSNATTCKSCDCGYFMNSTSNTCQLCTTCAENQYEESACFRSSDRQCANCTDGCETCSNSSRCLTCIEGFYLVKTNSSCLECTPCANNEFEAIPCSTSQNRDCRECRKCLSNEYNTTDCTTSADRKCFACQETCQKCSNTSTCDKCIPGYYIVGNDAVNVCEECTKCASNQYMSRDCVTTDSTDRQCEACPPHCETCTGTPNSGFPCKSCECGYYVDSDVGGECKECTTCASNQYEAQACYNSTNRVCKDCPTECATCYNTSTCRSCNTSFYLEVSTNTCQACRNCSADQFESIPCATSHDRNCTGCRTCLSNEYNTTDCTTLTDRECFACPPACATCSNASTCQLCIPGFYWDTINGSCQACRTCAANQFESSECVTSQDRNCTDCAPSCATCTNASTCQSCICEHFKTPDSTCQACKTCSVNQYESTQCSNSTDRQCSACSSPGVSCASGYYNSTENTCQACSSPCATCFSNTTCKSCVAGYYLVSGTNTCRACRNCTATQYETKACSNSTDRRCSEIYEERCLDKTFFNQNQQPCLPWVCSRPKYWFKRYRDLCDYWWCSISIAYRRNFRIRCARVQTMFFF